MLLSVVLLVDTKFLHYLNKKKINYYIKLLENKMFSCSLENHTIHERIMLILKVLLDVKNKHV